MSIASVNAGNMERTPNEADVLAAACHKILGLKWRPDMSHYELLGIDPTETDPAAIESVADMRMAHVRTYQTSPKFGKAAQQLLNRLANAKMVLLTPDQRARYDEVLKARIAQVETRENMAKVIPEAVIAAAAPEKIAFVATKPADAPAKKTAYWPYLTAGVAAVGISITGLMAMSSAGSKDKKNDDTVAAPTKTDDTPRTAPPIVKQQTATPAVEIAQRPVEANPVSTGAHDKQVFSETSNETAPSESNPPATPATQLIVEPVLPEQPIAPPPAETLLADASGGAQEQEKEESAFNKDTYAAHRKAVLEAVKHKGGVAKIDEILLFANNAKLMEEPERAKAVHVEAFLLSIEYKDLKRAHQSLKFMLARPDLFSKPEVEFGVTKVQSFIATADRATAFAVYDELQAKGFMEPEDVLQAKLLQYKKDIRTPAFRKEATPNEQQRVAHEMLDVARNIAEIQPEIAEKFAMDARFAFGPKSEANQGAKAAFDASAASTLAVIDAAKNFKRVNEAIAANPNDANAYRLRADILMSRGDWQQALSDLAKSNDPLSSLALETEQLSNQGNAASGKATYEVAQRWKLEAAKAKNGRQSAMHQYANAMLELAVVATTDVLDPFAKAKAEQMRKTATKGPVTTVVQKPVEKTEPVATTKAPVINAQEKTIVKPVSVLGNMKQHKHIHAHTIAVDSTTKAVTVESPGHIKMLLPAKITSKDFDVVIEVEFTRTNAKDTGVALMLPVGEGATLLLGMKQGDKSYTTLSNVAGSQVVLNRDIHIGGGKNLLQARVVQNGNDATIIASFNGIQASWRGAANSLKHRPSWETNQGQIGFGSVASTIVVHDIRTTVLKGTMSDPEETK